VGEEGEGDLVHRSSALPDRAQEYNFNPGAATRTANGKHARETPASSSALETAPPQLEYAAPPRAGVWRRRVLRWAAPVTVLALAVAAATQFVPRVTRHLETLRHQRDAVAHAAPRDFRIYRAETTFRQLRPNFSETRVRADPAEPIPWSVFRWDAGIRGTVAFLGEFPGKGDSRRIVVVTANMNSRAQRVPGPFPAPGAQLWSLGAWEIELSAYVVRPGSLTASPALSWTRRPALTARLAEGAPVLLFAGQQDPADPFHFTFDYQHGDARGVIDGWLRADDTVELAVRDGPAVTVP
jgi:hypothetical protein